jgi:hypothetical protein
MHDRGGCTWSPFHSAPDAERSCDFHAGDLTVHGPITWHGDGLVVWCFQSSVVHDHDEADWSHEGRTLKITGRKKVAELFGKSAVTAVTNHINWPRHLETMSKM